MQQSRIVHLSTVHRFADPRIVERECASLQNSGFQVSFVVPHDRSEVINGVTIIPIQKSAGRLNRFLVTQYRLLRQALKLKADLYHYHDPELLPTALVLKLAGRKVIVDVHENLSEQLKLKEWLPRPVRELVARLAGLVERWFYPFLDGIVVVVPDMLPKFPKKMTALVRNFPGFNVGAFEGVEPHSKRAPDILYVGHLEPARGSLEMIRAFNILDGRLDARLILGGRFADERHRGELDALSTGGNVDYPGWVSRQQIVQLLRTARVGLCLLQPTPNYTKALPTKAFEYMVAGLPVVATDLPLLTPIISEHKCGIVVPPYDFEAAAKAIEWLIANPEAAEDMGRRGQKAVLEHYSWAAEFPKLLDLYKSVLD